MGCFPIQTPESSLVLYPSGSSFFIYPRWLQKKVGGPKEKEEGKGSEKEEGKGSLSASFQHHLHLPVLVNCLCVATGTGSGRRRKVLPRMLTCHLTSAGDSSQLDCLIARECRSTLMPLETATPSEFSELVFLGFSVKLIGYLFCHFVTHPC